MSVLVDTNLLLRSLQPAHPHYAAATSAIRALHATGEPMVMVPQVIYEFWVVCTRPAGEHGLGMTTSDASVEQMRALSLFGLLPDTPEIFAEWQKLVVRQDVKGKPAHDARLVAAMRVHSIEAVLTFNGADFRRYLGINVIAPESLVPPPAES